MTLRNMEVAPLTSYGLMARRAFCAMGFLGALATASVCVAVQDEPDPVQAALVAESSALTPGGSVLLGLRLQHAPHWHTYWRNPGDSGLPTRLRFTLPAGYRVDDIAWPAPMRFDVGGLYNFGYTGDMLLSVRLHVPADAKAGDTAAIGADANWLMCREECIPGKAHLTLALPVRVPPAEADSAYTNLFTRAAQGAPQETAWRAQARVSGDSVTVALHGDDLPETEGLDAFVQERKLVNYALPRISSAGDGIELVFPKSDYFTDPPSQMNLLLVQTTGTLKAWHVVAPINPP
jgi:DsbC/DsbD-like thiol-disulfide interchange protein